ncbi:replicative DNA helicase [Bacillus sp. 2205SS5-2]|uniref:replicative DNA helicase n=1 Tax=Bacillus sp. 2205SS5-2 TaxID=3109031 RepID=UPI0030049B87
MGLTAEKAFIGSILKANYLLKDTVLQPYHFEDMRHRSIFQKMNELSQNGKATDVITLSTLTNLENIGGITYLNDLQSYANVEKFEDFEVLVLTAWKEREKRNILTRAKEEDWEIDQVVSSLDAINQSKLEDYSSIQTEITKIFEAPWQDETEEKSVTTGIIKLNQYTNGWQDGEVTIIAARPSMGKTDVLIHLAKQAGWQGNMPIIFSLEMAARSITNRLIASTGSFNRIRLRNLANGLSDKQKQEWPTVLGLISTTNIVIFDEAGQTISAMRAKTRRLIHQQQKKPVIFIDYLTLIRSTDSFGGNLHLQVTEISKNLKALAKEFNCPVICLAQLSRSVEKRADKRPLMSDIRESGSVEQDADIIIFLYREKYYDKASNSEILEMIIAKNRNGPVGTVPTRYNEHTGEVKDVLDSRII